MKGKTGKNYITCEDICWHYNVLTCSPSDCITGDCHVFLLKDCKRTGLYIKYWNALSLSCFSNCNAAPSYCVVLSVTSLYVLINYFTLTQTLAQPCAFSTSRFRYILLCILFSGSQVFMANSHIRWAALLDRLFLSPTRPEGRQTAAGFCKRWS